MAMLNKRQYSEAMRCIQRNTYIAVDSDQMRGIMTELQYALFADTIEKQHFQAVEGLIEETTKNA